MMKSFNISKRALIQLPPEADKIFKWAKRIYARSVLYNYRFNLLSKQEAEKLARKDYDEANRIRNLMPLTKNLTTLKEEIKFVEQYKLGSIPGYSRSARVDDSFDSGVTYLNPIVNDKRKANLPVWEVKPYNPNTLYHCLSHIVDLLLLFYNDLKDAGLNDEELTEKTLLKQQLIKDSQNEQPIKNISHMTQIPINKRLWEIYGLDKYALPSKITLQMVSTTPTGFKGEWEGSFNRLTLYIFNNELNPKSLEEYNNVLRELEILVQHEARHMVQTFINQAKNIDSAGLPKIKDPHYDQFGYTMYSTDRQDHALRNVEYHTRLAESVEEFKHLISSFPKSQQFNALKAFIGITPMFKHQNSIIITDNFFKSIQREIARLKNSISKLESPIEISILNDRLQYMKDYYKLAAKQFIKEAL